ncbi:MAG: InlB B-repeat-containing protein [Saccharofermentanales bacterium]
MSDDFSEYFLVNPLVTVSYDIGGGTVIPSETILKGGSVTPTTPKKSGYAFVGWEMPDGTLYDGNPITMDMTLKAVWGFKITLDMDDGTPIQYMFVKEGNTPIIPVPTRDGFVFDNWLLSDQTTYVEGPITGDIELKASWIESSTPSEGDIPGADTTEPPEGDPGADTTEPPKEDVPTADTTEPESSDQTMEEVTIPKTGEQSSSNMLFFGVLLISIAIIVGTVKYFSHICLTW